MNERITKKHLNHQIAYLNEMTGSPVTYSAENGDANIGHYHLSGAYGGWELHRNVNEGGGITCPAWQGYVTKREAHTLLNAFIRGVEIGKEYDTGQFLDG